MTGNSNALNHLRADALEFREMVTSVPVEDWDRPTPAEGWTVLDQVAHLAFVFDLAAVAATDAHGFGEAVEMASVRGFDAVVGAGTKEISDTGAFGTLDAWDSALDASLAALAAVRPEQLVPWLAGPLPVDVLAAAGMMETFAHGQDVADALGLVAVRTDRIERLVHFVHRTQHFGYLARGVEPPVGDLRFEVTLPSGRELRVGPEDAVNVVSGSAVALCLVAARRRHRDDTDICADGPLADAWLDVAQAYRGPAGPGRQAGQFLVHSGQL